MKGYSLDTGLGSTACSFKLVFVIVGGILIQLALGSFFTFGNMTPYVISYLRNRTDDANLRNVDALWVTSVGSVVNCFGMTAGGIADRRFGPRIATLIGSVIFGAAVLLTNIAVRTSMTLVVITYGVVLNFGMTMAYGPPVQTAIKWLPKRTTLAAGLIVGGFGGGAIIFNQVITAYINPDNLSPDLVTDNGDRYFTDPEVLDRVPSCFLILGACYLGMTLIGVLGLQLPPTYKEKNNEVRQINPKLEADFQKYDNKTFSGEDLHVGTQNGKNEKQYPNTLQVENGNITVSIDRSNQMVKLSLKQAIQQAFVTRSFYILWFTMMMLDGAFQFVIGLYKAYGQTFISDDHFLALVGSLSSIFNCLGRPFWGSVMDKFGYKVAMRGISGGFVIASATIIFTEHLNKAFFLMWICTLYFFFCGIWAVAPSTLSKLFGPNNMAINYGFIYVATTAASLIGGVAGLTLKDIIGWHGLFFLSSGMGAIPFILTFVFNGRDQGGKRF